MISVLVIDDHHLVRAGMIRMLRECPGISVIGEAGSGAQGIDLSLRLRPDVVLMDVRMPGIDGYTASRQVLQEWPEAKILAVTACDDADAAEQMIRAGAQGYVTKGSDMNALLVGIKRAYNGKPYISKDMAPALSSRRLKATSDKGPFDSLTGREMEVCRLVVAGRRAKEIARQLYITSPTVHTFRYRIFEKLGIGSNAELARLAVKYKVFPDLI